MIARDALRAISQRCRRPALLGLMGAYFAFDLGLLSLATLIQRFAAHGVHGPALLSARTIMTLTAGTLYLFLVSPLAWQWTGDAKFLARPLRGFLQSLAMNGFYILVGLTLNQAEVHRRLQAVQPGVPKSAVLPMMAVGMLAGLAFDTLVSFALAFWEAKTAEKEQALRQAEEARWHLLKAQMSPHVLLNSLNGLAELVREDTAAAVKGMRDLAEIYRQLLTVGEAPTVPLREERRLLERYLDVEKLRLGEALRVEWDWDPALDALPAMPLLLQPLVENAIKHGVAADPAGGLIHVAARREGRALLLSVSNTGQASNAAPRKGTGVGLRNLKSRLELAYGGRATFDLVREAPWTRAELRLPLEETR